MHTVFTARRYANVIALRLSLTSVLSGEVYSMTKTMTPDPGKYDPGKLNDDPDSMTTLNYDVPSLDLANDYNKVN